jgi:hypothetical protein
MNFNGLSVGRWISFMVRWWFFGNHVVDLGSRWELKLIWVDGECLEWMKVVIVWRLLGRLHEEKWNVGFQKVVLLSTEISLRHRIARCYKFAEIQSWNLELASQQAQVHLPLNSSNLK